MKNTSLIITSVVGGAILGATITCLLKSEKAKKMKGFAHDKILEEIKHLHAHLAGMCNCSETGECSCSVDGMKSMNSMEGMEMQPSAEKSND